MKNSINLTNRDMSLLGFLKEQGVATSSQLTEAYFGSYGAFRKRISFLIKGGLVESVMLKSGVHFVPSRMIEIRKSLSDEGRSWQHVRLYKLSKSIGGIGRSNDSPLSEPIFWQHQLSLNEVRAKLSSVLSGGVFISDPESKAEWARMYVGSDVPIPDLVWRKGKVEFAVEFERTNKGEMRYFQRMAKYHRSRYSRVLYVANTDDIYTVLGRCALRFPNIGVTSRSNLSKVFNGLNGIVRVEEFLREVKQ